MRKGTQMISQARITSDTTATVHLAEETVEVAGADLPEIRDRVKQVFITSAKAADEDLDVVIVEPAARHHLRVEPTGRISGRPSDDRPLHGPAIDDPLLDPPSESAPGTDATTDPGTYDQDAPSGPATGELGTGRPHGARRRQTAAMPPSEKDQRPTLQDLQTSTAKPERAKATRGVPGFITRISGGLISPRPNRRELRETERSARICRPLDGPRNIAVVNLKGGAHKTTASLMIAATLGVTRGGNVLAWDNNETRGTLGWRGIPPTHHRTAVDLLHDIDRMRAPETSSADLDPYLRPQGEMRFDILASDEDPGSAASIDAAAFGELNSALSRFYRIKVIDTGNNVRASNWLAAVKSADQLVIISTVREDTFNAAAWMIDELRATGLEEQVEHAVTVLSHSSKGRFDPSLRDRLLTHFGAHTRAVTEVPYEQQFVDGSHLEWSRVSATTKEAWLDATSLIVDGL